MFPIHDENPIRIKPIVTWVLLGLCIAVFLWQFSRGNQGLAESIYALGVTPALLFDFFVQDPALAWVPPEVTVFTSMFLHAGWGHLIGNLLYLWVFGNNIEAAMGRVKFLIFYLLCGVAAVFAQALPDTDSIIPMVGASGAISGVLGAYILLYPQVTVHVIVPILLYPMRVQLSALVVLALWFGMQLFSSFMSSGEGGGVAFGAHIGGFIAGIVLVGLFKRRDVPILIPFRDYSPLLRGRARKL